MSSNTEAIKKHILSIPKMLQEEPQLPRDGEGDDEETLTRDGIRFKKITNNTYDLYSLQSVRQVEQQVDALWPGAIIQGNGFATGNLDLVPVPRSPLTLTVTGLTPGASKSNSESVASVALFTDPQDFTKLQTESVSDLLRDYSIEVEDPTHGSVNNALIDWLQDHAKDVTAAHIVSNVRHVTTKEEASKMLSVNLEWPVAVEAGLSGIFNSINNEERELYTVSFWQPYYRVSANMAGNAGADYFSEDATVDELKLYTGVSSDGIPNPPLVISTVTYGRSLILSINVKKELSERSSKVNAYIKYIGSGDIHFEDRAKEVQSYSDVNAFIYGGGGKQGAQVIKDPKELHKWYTAGASFGPKSPAKPLMLSCRYLRDATAAGLKFVARREEVKTIPMEKLSTETIKSEIKNWGYDSISRHPEGYWLRKWKVPDPQYDRIVKVEYECTGRTCGWSYRRKGGEGQAKYKADYELSDDSTEVTLYRKIDPSIDVTFEHKITYWRAL